MDLLDDDPQLREALHAAVADGPDAPSLDSLLHDAHQAHRAQTLRRTAGGLAVAAAMAAVALTGAQLLTSDPGSRRSDDGVVAAESSKPLTLADPLDRRPDGRSWGVVVKRGDDELWGLVDWSPAGTMASVEPARARFAAVEDWLDYEVAASTGTLEPHPVAFDQNGTLVATGATRLVQQRTGMTLGPEDVMTAVAEIEVHGEHRFVVARITWPGGPSYAVLTPDQVPGGFEELVARPVELLA